MVDPPTIREVRGLESIIDALAGVLAEQSLEATLEAMAAALGRIVPYTSLAVYEVDWDARLLVPVFANGQWVAETLAERPRLDDSITGKAILQREVLNLQPRHPWIAQHQMPGTTYDDGEAFMVAPLMAGDRPFGSLNVWREQQVDEGFAEEEAQLVRRFATLAGIAYANASQRERLRQLALTDELTGLANRRHFVDRLASELARARREDGHAALVLLDIDDFKAINDRFGHATGDETLRVFARVVAGSSRLGDVVCRTGGEEFAVVLPSTGAVEALGCAQRLVAAVREADWPEGLRLTASAGVAVAPDGADGPESLFQLADERLLAAKALGKDRVAAAPPDAPVGAWPPPVR